MKIETLEIVGRKYLVKIIDQPRPDSTISIANNIITIKIPLALNREERFRQIIKMKNWAKSKIEKNPDQFKIEMPKEYHDGDVLKIGEEEYTLNVELKEKQSSSARWSGNAIHLAISSNLSLEKQQKHISSLLSRIVARKRLPQLQEKINALNKIHFNQPINKIFFKNTSSLWGSCSGERRNINISTRLLFAPDEVLESVCIHELAHLIEHNHSQRFWDLVYRACPDYAERKKWLNENGQRCAF